MHLRLLRLTPMADAALDALDSHGNTPLLLAYRMGRSKAARMLLAAGAYSKARAPEGWESVQVAALSGNTDLIRSAVIAYLDETDKALERRMGSLQARLASLPDFTLRMKWEFHTWVPLLGRLLPSDTYSIYKRGSSIRLDTTLLGMNGLKWDRGSVSMLVHGADMPRPGACYVIDNDMRTAADARTAFTHPQDIHIQDWVRKLLTQKQKSTDYWGRDVVMLPVIKHGIVGGLFRKVKTIARLGDSGNSVSNTPRGRISQNTTSTPKSSQSSVAISRGGDENGADAVDEDGSGTPAPAACDDPNQAKEEVGIWKDCAVYDMVNLCVRDVTHAPILNELKLADWWRPEYSKQTTDEEAAKSAAAASAAAASSSKTGSGKGGEAAFDMATAEAPEQMLKPLHKLLRAIRLGKINESNASAASTLIDGVAAHDYEEHDFGGGGDDGYGDGSGVDGLEQPIDGGGGASQAAKLAAKRRAAAVAATATTYTFAGYFGFERSSPSLDNFVNQKGGDSSNSSNDDGASAPLQPYVHAADGLLHRPAGRVAEFKSSRCQVDDKSLDAKVYFSKDFPISVEQFLPVAEVMARTSRHATNIRRFFSTKMPVGAGFPVRFTMPVFPAITATVTFEFCDTYRSPARSLFEVPKDYKMGAYVERGFVRQL